MDDAEREDHTREWGLPPGDLAAYVHALWDKATTPNDVPAPEMASEPVISKGSTVGSSTSSPGPQDGGGTASAVG